MSKKKDIRNIMFQLASRYGNAPTFDEEAIVSEYEKKNADDTGMLIKLVTIFGAILAAIALLFFMGITNLYNSAAALLIFGTGFIAGSVWLNAFEDGLTLVTASITGYMVGITLFCFGLEKMGLTTSMICTWIIAISITSFFITRSYLFSFISVILICGSFLGILMDHKTYDLVYFYISIITILLTFVFVEEPGILRANKLVSMRYEPIRSGLMAALIFGLVIAGVKGIVPISPDQKWVAFIPTMAAIIYLIYRASAIFSIATTGSRWLIYIIALVPLALTVSAPAISGSLLILFLSFYANYKTGLIIGILSLVYFTCQYYYDLNFTLLTKSCFLFISGIIFVLLYLFINKKWNDEKI